MSETWQTVLQIILTPTLIVGTLAFVMRELFKSYLSIDVERYKSELQSDLESHKAKLKAEYDARQFEFQTKFSWFYQKRAELAHEFFAQVLEIRDKVERFYYGEQNIEWLDKLKEDYNNFITLFIKSRLYFNEELCKKIGELRDSMSAMIDSYIETVYSRGDMNRIAEAGNKMVDTHQAFRRQSNESIKEIELEIRKLLSSETPNYQIEKKQ